MDESTPTSSETRTEVAPGIHAAYELPEEDEGITASEPVDTSVSLEELMAQMKSM